MKKLLLPLPLILFGCSKDRNYDGEVTISDYAIFFENICISIGKFTVGILNALIDTDLGKFFELNKINPYGDTLFNFGAWTIIIVAIITFMSRSGD